MARKFTERVGEIYPIKNGGNAKIVEYFGSGNCTVELDDGTLLFKKEYRNIVNGSLYHPLRRDVLGVGYLGVGDYSRKSHPMIHKKWSMMLDRCYSEPFKKVNTSYIDCLVCPEWLNFQNFAKWMESVYTPYMKGWELDKDIIVKHNKVYSPEACAFVPKEVNTSLIFAKCGKEGYPIGVYKNGNGFIVRCSLGGNKCNLGTYKTVEEAFIISKSARETEIKRIANKYKGQIDERVYEALMNYKIEITD